MESEMLKKLREFMGWNPVEPKPSVFKIDSHPVIQTKFNLLSAERYNINTEMHLCC